MLTHHKLAFLWGLYKEFEINQKCGKEIRAGAGEVKVGVGIGVAAYLELKS